MSKSAKSTKSTKNAKNVIVIWGPSGVGKSTLIKRLLKEFPNRFALSVSHTSRSARPGETDGVEYNFVCKNEFKKLLDIPGFFLESTEFNGNYYGTSVQAIEDVTNHGKVCVLDIDLNGVKSVYKLPSLCENCLFVRLIPEDLQLLRGRLQKRGEPEESIRNRLKIADADLYVDTK